jgi:hypothetical protein
MDAHILDASLSSRNQSQGDIDAFGHVRSCGFA